MEDRELLEYVAAHVGKLTQDVGKLTQNMGKLTQDVENLTQDVGKLTQDVGKLTQDVGKLNQDVGEIKEELRDVSKRVTKVETIYENDISIKLEALLDGYKQNAEKINRIEHEVTKQEEIIMRRVK